MKIQQGEATLVVTVFGAQPGQRVYITEVDGDKTQRLRYFYWTPSRFWAELPIVGE
jgi:hypothetical protein